jgi:hypothetical protein
MEKTKPLQLSKSDAAGPALGSVIVVGAVSLTKTPVTEMSAPYWMPVTLANAYVAATACAANELDIKIAAQGATRFNPIMFITSLLSWTISC